MSKYSNDQLQKMARTVIHARLNHDSRYEMFVMSLVIKANIDVGACVQQIEEMAQDVFRND